MSYARAKSRQIQVGQRAAHDVILAQASLDAAKLLKLMMTQPRASRTTFLRNSTLEYGPRAYDVIMRKALAAKGTSGDDQALFDALRLVIANYYASRGVEMVNAAMARQYGADQGLGVDWTKIGCATTGLVTAAGGAVAGAYTGGAGAGVVGAGGNIVASSIGCNKGAEEAALRVAAANAAQADAEARTAATMAAREAAAGAEKTKRLRTAMIVGGGVLSLVVMGFMIVKL